VWKLGFELPKREFDYQRKANGSAPVSHKAYERQCDEVNPVGAHQLKRLLESGLFFVWKLGFELPKREFDYQRKANGSAPVSHKAYERQCDEVNPVGAHQLKRLLKSGLFFVWKLGFDIKKDLYK